MILLDPLQHTPMTSPFESTPGVQTFLDTSSKKETTDGEKETPARQPATDGQPESISKTVPVFNFKNSFEQL